MDFEISIEKVKNSRILEFDTENIGFGKIFSDHMFVSDWNGEEWTNHRIIPYGPFTLSPATSAIHYGQSIFEGMKAFGSTKNEHDVLMFRPEENAKRLNRSAKRMAMPEIPEDLLHVLLNGNEGMERSPKNKSIIFGINIRSDLYLQAESNITNFVNQCIIFQ
jgi:branched-chain amino acid aminotransferase